MAFTGKATYDGGTTLPEQAEDLTPSVFLIAQKRTPLLARLQDPARAAMSTHVEWLEDSLNPNTDTLTTGVTTGATAWTTDTSGVYRAGDIVRPVGSDERVLVTSVSGAILTVTRGYGSTTAEAVTAGVSIDIIGNAFLEADSAPAARFQNKSRVSNYTQLFMDTVLISDTNEQVRKAGGYGSEHDYQLARRLEEQLILLERSVISGVKAAATPEGSDSVRRTMHGISRHIESGTGTINLDKGGSTALTESVLNDAIRQVWDLGGMPDTIVVSSFQKKKISDFLTSNTRYAAAESAMSTIVRRYESDFGEFDIVLSPHCRKDEVLILDTQKIEVVPLVGMSFHAKPLASAGSHRKTLLQGEYTVRLYNPKGHGRIHNLTTS